MLEIVSFSATGQAQRHDLHSLKLADGTPAHTVSDPGELFRRLKLMNVTGIKPNMGHQDLLMAFSKHLAAEKAAKEAAERQRQEDLKRRAEQEQ